MTYDENLFDAIDLGIRSKEDLRGIIPSSFAHIFDSINQTKSRQFLVRASYLEIYNVRF